MGVLKIITFVASIILGATSIKIDYVPLNPNYLPYFDPSFNPQDYLSHSASTNYLIPKIQSTSTQTSAQNNQPIPHNKPHIFTPPPNNNQRNQERTGNAEYLRSNPPAQTINTGKHAQYLIAPEDFGKRISESIQKHDENSNTNVPAMQELQLKSSDFEYQADLRNSGYSNFENLDKQSSGYPMELTDEYYRNLEKQAELETEAKIRNAMKKPVYVKKPGVYSSYVLRVNKNPQNSAATAKVESYQEVNYGNADGLKLRRGRILEPVHLQGNEYAYANNKVADVVAETNDWEPITAPYDPHYYKEELSDDHGEIHYHQHKHIHKHEHQQDHKHLHEQDHKHLHESSHNHGHSHDEKHGHEHQGSHKHGHEHQGNHQHSHNENHGHAHNHQHQHAEAHKHGHQEAHKHDHGHQHSHGHDHQHTSEHQHGHKHGHQHSHQGEHSHGHNHGHKHSHDHGHKHSHVEEHKHGHEHGHKHGHQHGHKHGHAHSKH